MGASGYILIADDDLDLAEVMTLVLTLGGYQVKTARNGREALDRVAEEMPELILLDMLMPVMDGWECAGELRARYGRVVPIVVVTAAEHARARADEIGADDVLSKPFEVSHLLEIVARHLAGAMGQQPAV